MMSSFIFYTQSVVAWVAFWERGHCGGGGGGVDSGCCWVVVGVRCLVFGIWCLVFGVLVHVNFWFVLCTWKNHFVFTHNSSIVPTSNCCIPIFMKICSRFRSQKIFFIFISSFKNKKNFVLFRFAANATSSSSSSSLFLFSRRTARRRSYERRSGGSSKADSSFLVSACVCVDGEPHSSVGTAVDTIFMCNRYIFIRLPSLFFFFEDRPRFVVRKDIHLPNCLSYCCCL